MSWECPHQSGEALLCSRRGQPCRPLETGCVLCGRVTSVGDAVRERVPLPVCRPPERGEKAAAAAPMTADMPPAPPNPAWQLTVCRGAESCAAGLVALAETAAALEDAVRRSAWADHLRRTYPEGHRPHHRLRIAVAACPNACPQPQICDIGLIAGSRPRVRAVACTACGSCLDACREGALALSPGLALDPARCVGCAACARVCAADALVAPQPTFRLLLGGQLGRHPAWAEELPLRLAPHQLGPALERVIALLVRHARPGERVGATVRRLGLAAFTDALCGT